jgi:hypothetical protein
MTFTSELVTAHHTSPDPMIPGCRNTLAEEPGVVFQGVEPLEGTHMFIGQTSIIEAVALLFNLTPDQVNQKLTPRKKAEIK